MIVIPEELLAAIVAHAREEAPQEVCGWLAGEGYEIRRAYPVPNVAENPRVGFAMDPEMQLSTMREIRNVGLELTGTYHSHPRTLPVPSPRDQSLALYPDAAHLIVSLARGAADFRCYRITGSGIFEVAFSVRLASRPDHPPQDQPPPDEDLGGELLRTRHAGTMEEVS